jgi:mRNA interferase HicA
MTGAQFKRYLAKLGCTFEPGNGGHLKVSLGGKRSILPMQAETRN